MERNHASGTSVSSILAAGPPSTPLGTTVATVLEPDAGPAARYSANAPSLAGAEAPLIDFSMAEVADQPLANVEAEPEGSTWPDTLPREFPVVTPYRPPAETFYGEGIEGAEDVSFGASPPASDLYPFHAAGSPPPGVEPLPRSLLLPRMSMDDFNERYAANDLHLAKAVRDQDPEAKVRRPNSSRRYC